MYPNKIKNIIISSEYFCNLLLNNRKYLLFIFLIQINNIITANIKKMKAILFKYKPPNIPIIYEIIATTIGLFKIPLFYFCPN